MQLYYGLYNISNSPYQFLEVRPISTPKIKKLIVSKGVLFVLRAIYKEVSVQLIQFKRLYIDGAFSYGKGDIGFEPGLVLLDGINKDEGERISNMAGKTSVFNSLATVLFEQNSKNQIKDDIINVFGQDTAIIGVEIETAGKQIVLEYIRGKKSDWTVKVNGESQTKSIREVKTYISKLIDMDYIAFLVSSYMEQGSLGRLMNMKDEEKKRLIAQYFGLDRCGIFRDNIKIPRQRATEELISVNTLINQLSTVNIDDKLADRIIEVEAKLIQIDGGPVSNETYELALTKFNEILTLSERYPNAIEILDEAKQQLAEVSSKLVWCSDVVSRIAEDKCYICGSKIDGKQLKASVEKLYQDKLIVKKQIVIQIAELEKVCSKLRYWNKEKEQLELEKLKNRVIDIDAYRQNIELLGSLKKQRELQDKAVIQLNELKEKKKELDTVLEILDFWYEGFGPRGIQTMVLDKLLSGLNACIKTYAGRFGWDITCIMDNDRLIFNVKDKWKQLKIGYFSGSESMLVGLLVSLGVWRWLNLRGKGTNILFLDEVFAPFDAEMRIRVAELLKDIAKDRCVVITTHNEDMKNFIQWDRVWQVTKQNGISNLKVY